MTVLSADDRAALLVIARQALHAAVEGRRAQAPPVAGELAEPTTGAFVTLTVDGALRGCTGAIDSDVPLAGLITRLAASSAVADPRFPPLRPSEAAAAQIEISILSPPEPIAPADVRVGTHGLVVERGGRRGLLLPQVALEHGFTADDFLAATCWKAGLPRDAWRDPATTILAFTAVVFAESPHPSLLETRR